LLKEADLADLQNKGGSTCGEEGTGRRERPPGEAGRKGEGEGRDLRERREGEGGGRDLLGFKSTV
jgi:hypothetical protein